MALTDRLAADLFPPPTPASPSRWRRVAGEVGLVGLAIASLLTARDGTLRHRVWAEDASRILTGAYSDPLARLWDPIHGYLNFFPRLVSLGMAAVPVESAALALALVATATKALLGWFVLRACEGHLRSAALRYLLFAGIVFLPVANGPMLNSVINAHWWLVWAAFWALLSRPEGWWVPSLGAAICFVAAVSNPLMVLLIPIAALRLWTVREARQQLTTAALALGVALQLVASLDSIDTASTSLADVPRAIGVRVVLSLFGGNAATEWLWLRFSEAAVMAAAALLVLALSVALVRERGRRAPLAAACAVLATAFATIPFLLRPGHVPVPDTNSAYLLVGGRYSWLPVMWLLTIVLLAVDRSPAPAPRWQSRLPALALVVAFTGLWSYDWWHDRGPGSRPYPHLWEPAVRKAAKRCAAEGLDSVEIPVPPRSFRAIVPCSRLGWRSELPPTSYPPAIP